MSEQLAKFKQLSDIRQKAVKMRAEGTTIEAISTELSVPYRTLQEWYLDQNTEELDEYKAFLADKQIAATESFQEKAAKDAAAVWDKLLSLALSDEPSIPQHVILGAMDSVLDRAGIARVSKTEGKHTVALTDEDRRKRFETIRALQTDLEPTQLMRLAGGKA